MRLKVTLSYSNVLLPSTIGCFMAARMGSVKAS